MRGIIPLTLCLAGVLLVAAMVGSMHLALPAVMLMMLSVVVSAITDWAIRRTGPQGLVLAYWVGVAVRSGLAIVGGLVLGARWPREQWANFALWLLTTYLLVLILETVRQVRTADAQQREGNG
jgi:NADH:ubiquinone oxidoreductase subunit 6 (subunit J)